MYSKFDSSRPKEIFQKQRLIQDHSLLANQAAESTAPFYKQRPECHPSLSQAERMRGSNDSHIFHSFLECAFVSSHVNGKLLKQVQSTQVRIHWEHWSLCLEFSQSHRATVKCIQIKLVQFTLHSPDPSCPLGMVNTCPQKMARTEAGESNRDREKPQTPSLYMLTLLSL